MYTINDARREIKEMIEGPEYFSFTYIWIFLNDLRRSHDITADEQRTLLHELVEMDIDHSLKTF